MAKNWNIEMSYWKKFLISNPGPLAPVIWMGPHRWIWEQIAYLIPVKKITWLLLSFMIDSVFFNCHPIGLSSLSSSISTVRAGSVSFARVGPGTASYDTCRDALEVDNRSGPLSTNSANRTTTPGCLRLLQPSYNRYSSINSSQSHFPSLLWISK